MDIALIEALLYIAKFCVIQEDCSNCPIHDLCGKLPIEW